MQESKKTPLYFDDSQPRISVIIPLGPGEKEHHKILEAQLSHAYLEEFILACSSLDQYLEQLRRYSWAVRDSRLKVIMCPEGRAIKLNAASRFVRGNFLWFVHADARFNSLHIKRLYYQLHYRPQAAYYFRLKFSHPSTWLLHFNALFANWRAKHLGIPFGDQSFCLSKRRWQEAGNFPSILGGGEEVYWLAKLRRERIPLLEIEDPIATSSRKYERQGWLKTTLSHIAMSFRLSWKARQYVKGLDYKNKAICSSLVAVVKNPEDEGCKEQLAEVVGQSKSQEFYRACLKATHALLISWQNLNPATYTSYWAPTNIDKNKEILGEDLEYLRQGSGRIGQRIRRVFSKSKKENECVILIEADTPQLPLSLIERANQFLRSSKFPRLCLGPSTSGGFYLLASNFPLPSRAFKNVAFGEPQSIEQLKTALPDWIEYLALPSLTQLERIEDIAKSSKNDSSWDLLEAQAKALGRDNPNSWIRIESLAPNNEESPKRSPEA